MRRYNNQMDIFRDDPSAIAKANRLAAETAIVNPYSTTSERQERHAFYIAEAEKFERIAGMN